MSAIINSFLRHPQVALERQRLERLLFGAVPRRRYRARRPATPAPTYLKHREEARHYIQALLAKYTTEHTFTIKRVAIKDTKRRWGSCSAKGNLNFSYKLLFLPPCLARYIVVHELCHLRELHHGPTFWQEVATIMPDYEARIEALRRREKVSGTGVRSLQAWRSEHNDVACVHCQRDVGLPPRE